MRWSKSTRISLAVLGVLVVVTGWVWWSSESHYGLGLDYEMVGTSDSMTVYEFYPTTDERTAVFEGTEEEALAYIDGRQREAVNLLVPNLVMGAGALLVLIALIPARGSEATASSADQ